MFIMKNVIANWGSVHSKFDQAQSAAWLKLAAVALEKGGVLPLDPRDDEHAMHINARLGDDQYLSRYFPRKADMMRATAAIYDLYGKHPNRSLLEMGQDDLAYTTFQPYVGVPHFVIDQESNAAVATAVVSHTHIVHALEMVLEVVDADTGELLGVSSVVPQFNTRYQRLSVGAPISTQVGSDGKPRRLLAGLTTNYCVDGQPYANPTLAVAAVADPQAISSVTPYAPLPIHNPGASFVTIIIERADHNADYYYYPGTPNPIYVPFSGAGTLLAGYTLTSPVCQSGSLTLIAQGGGAQYAMAQSVVAASFSGSGASFTWKMPDSWMQNFTTSAGTNVLFDITLQASINTSAGLTALNVASFGTVTNGGNLLPLSISWGCVAPWTVVRKADGSQCRIDQIRAGDQLLADQHGRIVQVQRVISGDENKTMWRLRAGACEVLATHDHPMLTLRGPQAIASLQVGDVLLSADGEIMVDSIAEENYHGQVVNLVLQSQDGVIPLQGDSFIAGGFVIGDNTMQNALATRQDVPSLPVEWQVDAANAANLVTGQALFSAA